MIKSSLANRDASDPPAYAPAAGPASGAVYAAGGATQAPLVVFVKTTIEGNRRVIKLLAAPAASTALLVAHEGASNRPRTTFQTTPPGLLVSAAGGGAPLFRFDGVPLDGVGALKCAQFVMASAAAPLASPALVLAADGAAAVFANPFKPAFVFRWARQARDPMRRNVLVLQRWTEPPQSKLKKLFAQKTEPVTEDIAEYEYSLSSGTMKPVQGGGPIWDSMEECAFLMGTVLACNAARWLA